MYELHKLALYPCMIQFHQLKGALDKCNIIPQLFQQQKNKKQQQQQTKQNKTKQKQKK